MGGGRWRRPEEVRRVAVIGSGLIGGGWVATFLASGRAVAVFDPDPEAPGRVRSHVERAWDEIGARAPGADREAISFHASLDEALAGADFVQEAGPERVEAKAALFEELDAQVAADVVIASSTSSLAISELSAGCTHPGRFVLGHPFNPVHLMPLVETGGGPRTDEGAIDSAQALYAALGKQPVRLHREIFGHIANRLTSAMFREAVSLVAGGFATVADVDAAIRYGPALKWAIQGQFTTFHTSGGEGGLAGFLRHFAPGIVKRWQTMSDPDLLDPDLQAELVRQTVESQHGRSVEEISREQDRALAEILALLARRTEANPS
jgi:3-hydroxyacyl-CoA dehydrogenase